MPIEHGMHGADGGGLQVRVATLELLADLGRTPARVLALEGDDQRLHLERQKIL
jgi:hypothetical protein